MDSTVLTLTSNTTDFTVNLDVPIYLDDNKDYMAAFNSLFTYNSVPNISQRNNKFRYSTDRGTTFKTVVLPTGAYEVSEINNEIQRQMILNNDFDSESSSFYIEISFDKPTAKATVEVKHDNYVVDINCENSIGYSLGFIEDTLLTKGFHISHNIIDIEPVNTILVHCNFITGSYINNKQSQVIYAFTPTVSPGYKIIETPRPQLIFYPVAKLPKIQKVRIWLTDQNDKLVDLRGEKITVSILVKAL